MLNITNDAIEFFDSEGKIYIYGSGHNSSVIGGYMLRCHFPFQGFLDEKAGEDVFQFAIRELPVFPPSVIRKHKGEKVRILISEDSLKQTLTVLFRLEQMHNLNLLCLLPVYTDFGGRMEPAFDLNYMLGFFRRRLLKYPDISIVSNECTAGFFYRWLGMEVNSPTVGTYMSQQDFAKVVQNPEKYLLAEEAVFDRWIQWANGTRIPVCQVKDIHIIFPHNYKKAGNAEHVWNMLRKRVNLNRLLFVYAEDEITDGREAVDALNDCHFPNIVFSRGNQYVDQYTNPRTTKLILKHGYAHSRELPIEDALDLLALVNEAF